VREIRLAAGTRNPAKLEGIEAAFRRLGYKPLLEPVAVHTGLPPQPVGIREALRGAVLRAYGALRRAGGDLGVGVEAGLVEVPGTISGYMDVEACAVVDMRRRVTLGLSPGFEFPTRSVLRAVHGLAGEMEDEMVRLSGWRGIADREGGIGFLTGGAVDRPWLTEAAVLMAMVPRLKPWLYGEPRSVEDVLGELAAPGGRGRQPGLA